MMDDSRYITGEMRSIWCLEAKYAWWWSLELDWLENAVDGYNFRVKYPCKCDLKAVEAIKLIETKTQHEFNAFLLWFEKLMPLKYRAHIHLGLTSSDVQDTTLSIQIRESLKAVMGDVNKLLVVIEEMATRYKGSVMVGRTHGIHAEPITFGFKCLLWREAFVRILRHLLSASREISYGKLSGPVGTGLTTSIEAEAAILKLYNLEPTLSSQIIHRDRHAFVLAQLSILASEIENVAVELRNLQRTEIAEVQESFSEGQTGSSAMPHKQNPINSERLVGLARVVRANQFIALENMTSWHERDLTASSAERIAIPQMFFLTHYMVKLLTNILTGLRVDEQRMLKNMDSSHGVAFSSIVLHTLMKHSRYKLPRSKLWGLIQKYAFIAMEDGIHLKTLLLKAKDIKKYFGKKYYSYNTVIDHCFDVDVVKRAIRDKWGMDKSDSGAGK